MGEAETGRQAVQLTRKLRPAVVVMDIAMPQLNGLEATRQIRRDFPDTKVLILSAHSDEAYVEQVAELGAVGFLLKQTSSHDLATAIREVHHRPIPALFQVGTSVVDITPKTPMADGGYGSNYIVTGGAHDPLQVRAFFIGHGKHAVVFESVDSQGWFAAYQAPNTGDGADDARREAAAALAARGYDVTSADIVESATHDHAAPTLMGIWGHTHPAYLHEVKEAAVRAVLKAESNARPAELWSATGTIHGLLSEVQGTDQMAGFAVDDQLPILWAREPGTGATIGMYAQRAGPRRSVRPDRAG